MNEELKIIIRAITTEAQKNIAAVREQLEKTEGAGDKAAKTTTASMAAIAKGAAATVATIVALTAAMSQLGKTANDIDKGIARLKSSFKDAGASAKDATKYYKDLFGVLGDHDRAIEAGQSVARITTDPTALNDYKNIIAGGVAKYGEGYNAEALTENIAEALASGALVGDLERVFLEAGISIDGFNAALAQTANLEERELLIRNTLNGVLGLAGQQYLEANQALIKYNESQANLNLVLASASAYTLPLLTSLNNLSSELLTAFAPALETVAIYLTGFIQLMAEAVSWVGSLFGVVSDKTDSAVADFEGYNKAQAKYLEELRAAFGGTNNELDGTKDKLDKIKKATMGFDELNIVSSNTTASTGGAFGGSALNLPQAPRLEDYGLGGGDSAFKDFTEEIEKAKENLKKILPIIGVIVAAFGGLKLAKFIKELGAGSKEVKALKDLAEKLGFTWKGFDKEVNKAQWKAGLKELGARLKVIGGKILALGGAIALVTGAFQAWNSSVNWGNLITMLVGVAAAVGGVLMAFGKVPALFAAVVGGVVLVVTSLKDIIQNGASVENVIGLVAGALLVIIPIVIAFNTALMANPIMLVVAAAAALVAGLAILITSLANEKEAILSVQEAEENYKKAKEELVNVENEHINAVDAAEASLKRLKDAEEKNKLSGEELAQQVRDGKLAYEDMNEAQKEVYKAYLDNEEKQKTLIEVKGKLKDATDAERKAYWDNEIALAAQSDSYEELKKKVTEAFKAGGISAEEARDIIGKSMSGMSRDAQATFLKDVPDAIKTGLDPKQYETTGQKFSKWWSGVWGKITSYWSSSNANANFNVVTGYTLGVPQMATGGIVSKSTIANIGEAGREAVLPLDRNTEWQDELAEKVAAKNNTPTKVVLMLNEHELGSATIGAINGITKQTGQLQLTLA